MHHYVSWISRACPVCGAHDRYVLFRDRNRREGYAIVTNLMVCNACNMRFLDPVSSSEDWLKEYSVIYVRQELSRPGFLKKVAVHLIYLWQRLWSPEMKLHEAPFGAGNGRRLLDVGCSSGDKLLSYQRRGFSCYGVDVNEQAIADARRRVSGEFVVGRFEDVDYPDGYFDFIRFDNVLEHVYEPRGFLSKVHRLLRPGGIAYGFVPNGISPTMQLLGKYSISSWIPFHINYFPAECLKTLAENVGFETQVLQLANPNWVGLSALQWLNRNQISFSVQRHEWIFWLASIPVAPIWWLLTRIWEGEEVALIARRPLA